MILRFKLLLKVVPLIYNGEKVKLHQVWDNCFDEFTGDETMYNIKKISQRIVTLYPANHFGSKINDLNPAEWSKEGYDNAVNYAYKTPENKIPSNNYISASKELIEEEVALAGYRLASVLNTFFDK